MPTRQARHYAPAGAGLFALITTVAGAVVVRHTLNGTSDGSALSVWSVLLAAIWVLGWFIVTRWPDVGQVSVAPRGNERVGAHPLAFSIIVGAGFAGISLAGAIVLRYLPYFGSEVTGTTSRVTEAPLVVFLVALGTGAAEELFFRLGLARLLPRRWFPAVSTFAYGLVTLATGNVALTLAAVLLGATSGVAYSLTGRWYTPIVIHGMWTVALVGVLPLL